MERRRMESVQPPATVLLQLCSRLFDSGTTSFLLRSCGCDVDGKRTNSNTRRLKRDDAATLERIDKRVKVQENCVGQRVRLAAARASKLNYRRLSSRARGEKRPEIRIGRHDNPIVSRDPNRKSPRRLIDAT